MSGSHVISGLIAKKAELSGLFKHYQLELGKIASDLQHIDATIKLFDPKFDLRTVKAKGVRERNQYFKPGECARITLNVLRESTVRMNSRDIAVAVQSSKGLDGSPDTSKQVQKSVFATLGRLEAKGLAKRTGKEGLLYYWQLT